MFTEASEVGVQQMSERSAVMVVGSANQDIVVEVPRQLVFGETILGESVQYIPGGKGLNQGCAAASTGLSTYFVGSVGDDAAGEQLLGALTKAGADVSLTKVSPGTPSGTAHILVDAEGSNQIVVVPSANNDVDADQVRAAFQTIPEAKVLVLQGEIPLEPSALAQELMEERGGRVVFNLAPATQVPERMLSLSDPLVVNEFEAGIVLGVKPPRNPDEAIALVPALLEKTRSVIITLGKQGAVVADPSAVTAISEHHVPVSYTHLTLPTN